MEIIACVTEAVVNMCIKALGKRQRPTRFIKLNLRNLSTENLSAFNLFKSKLYVRASHKNISMKN